MNRFKLVTVAALAAAFGALVVSAQAQSSSPGGSTMGHGYSSDAASTAETGATGLMDKLGLTYHPSNNRSVLEDKAEAQILVDALKIPCELTDAALVGSGKLKVEGANAAPVRIIEVSCSSGMGYILESRVTTPPTGSGMSCFAAEGTRADAVAKGQDYQFYCRLKGNVDIDAMAQRILAKAGTACAVKKLIWFGASQANHLDYTEVVCDDGKGYLLSTALPGWDVPTSAMSCADAAQLGIKCKLTDAGPVVAKPTKEDFIAALAHNNVACDVKDLHLVGRETVQKRYVVEFQCPQQPKGLVAFIPLAGNTNKFETRDCASAAQIGVKCKLTGNN